MGLPKFFYLDNSLQSPKLSLLLRPPPHFFTVSACFIGRDPCQRSAQLQWHAHRP